MWPRNAGPRRSARPNQELLQSQGDRAASVVLMSWQDIEKEADKFREDIVQEKKSLAFASRFGFLKKTEVRLRRGRIPRRCGGRNPARHLPVIRIGRVTHAALEAWLESAMQAVEDLRGDIEHLHLKDFA